MDVDIDVTPSFNPERYFPNWVRAAVLRDDQLTPHPCGVYPQAMAKDPVTKLAAIPYEAAEELGYLKVDFLHLNLLQHVRDRQELEELVKQEPDWTLLQLPSTWPKLFQMSKHGELLQKIKPKSIEELADAISLIRPSKKQFIGLYLKERDACRKILYARDDDGSYGFKRSHAVAYALNIVIQLNLISQGRL